MWKKGEERGESRKGERYISVSEIVRRQKLTKARVSCWSGSAKSQLKPVFFLFLFFFFSFLFFPFFFFFPSRTERNGVTNKSEASIEICVRTKIEPSEIRTGEDRKRALTSLVISLSPPQR